ncbi:MAG: hypothetical protein ACHQIM_16440 [Sphingobacteriales bacterium]
MHNVKLHLEKLSKISLSYIAAGFILVEICIDIFLNQNPSDWGNIRILFIIANVAIMLYLLNIKEKEDRLNTSGDLDQTAVSAEVAH